MGNFSGAQGQLTLQCMVLLGLIAQPAGVHYTRGVSSLKPDSGLLAKTLITLEPHGIF